MKKRLRLKMNLQLFSAEGGAAAVDSGAGTSQGGSAPVASTTPAAQPQSGGTANFNPQTTLKWPGLPTNVENPLFQGDTGTPAAQTGQPPAQPPAQPNVPQTPVEKLNFGGREVEVIDPIIKDLHKDYTHLNRTYTEASQQLKQLQEQNQMLMQMVQTFQQMAPQMQQQQQVQQPQPQGPTQEEIQKFNEEYLNVLYENPLEANAKLMQHPLIQQQIRQMVEAAVKPVIEPITKQQQYNAEYQQMVQKYPDFNDLVPAMQQAIQMYPDLENQSLERIYLTAKGLTAQNQQPMTPEQLLADPKFREAILQNEEIKNQFISGYIQSVQNQQQQTPPVMGNHPGAQMPTSLGEQKPTTLREGTKLFQKWLNNGFGG